MREALHCVGGMGGGENDKEVVRLLLKAGADLNLVNKEEDTPFSDYYLESCHFNAIMKLMIDHVEKLQTAKLFIGQKNKQFMIGLAKERDFFHPFRKSNNIDVLVKIWEKNEYVRNKFISRDLNEEKELKKILKERYSKYAGTLREC